MAVNLQKGQKVSLVKSNGAKLTKLMVGLGWDAIEEEEKGGFFSRMFGGGKKDFDCDASVFVCKNGKITSVDDIIYFGNLEHNSGAIQHMGDNLTGEGEGDDEQVFVDLNKIPADYDKLVFVVNIYKAVERKQDFGIIKNAYIRIIDNDNGEELCRYNLSGGDYNGMLAMIVGEVYRYKGDWKFNAVGNGTTDPGLQELSRRFA